MFNSFLMLIFVLFECKILQILVRTRHSAALTQYSMSRKFGGKIGNIVLTPFPLPTLIYAGFSVSQNIYINDIYFLSGCQLVSQPSVRCPQLVLQLKQLQPYALAPVRRSQPSTYPSLDASMTPNLEVSSPPQRTPGLGVEPDLVRNRRGWPPWLY